jgi:outer membrane protein assembly factor BamB
MVHELRETADVTAPAPSRRWIPVAAAGVLGVLVVGGIAVGVSGHGSSGTASVQATATRTGAATNAAAGSAANAAPGSATSGVAAAPGPATAPRVLTTPPAALDIGPPPGFAIKPLWALPVAGSNAVTVSADGLIVTRTTDRQVALVDPATGAVRWHAPVPDDAAGPYLSRVGDKRVVAVLTPSALLYWPLGDGGTPGSAAPVAITLPAGSAVTWAGPSPLVTLGDGTAAVVRGTAVQRVSLPTGARPLAADGTDVLAVAGRNWIRQAAGQAPGTPQQLALPQGATGQTPVRVENVGGSFLGAMWAGPDGPIVAVYDAHTGSKLVQATFPKDMDFSTAPTVREIGSERTTVGTALFDPARRNLSILESVFTPIALTPGHVFAGETSGSIADLQITGKAVKAVTFTGRNPTIPAGIVSAGSRSLAIVVVPNGSGWLLAALPPD